MKKITVYFFSCLFVITASILMSGAIADNKLEVPYTPENIPVPHTTYRLLYTIHAKKAILLPDKKGNFRLVLREVHENTTCQFSQPKKLSGLIKTNEFMQMWKSKHASNVEADVTGLQQDNQTVGHSQFYVRGRLSSPRRVDPINNELEFTLSNIYPAIQIKQAIYMKNVSLFINGCCICSCKTTNHSCLIPSST